MRGLLLRTYPWTASSLVGASFAATYAAARFAPALASYAIPAFAAVAIAGASVAAYGLSRTAHSRRVAALTAATPAALVAAAFGCFLIVDRMAGVGAVAATAVVLTAAYLTYLRGMVKGDERFRPQDFSHLSFAVHAVSVFFTLLVAYGMPDYLQLPVPAASVVVALIVFVATAETLRRAGLVGRDVAILSFAFVALAVQLFIGLSFLPTSDLVNAAVGTLLYAAGLHVAVSMLDPRVPAPAYRRQFAFTLLLVVVVLSTARWA